jgi:hypothetical protein
MHLIRRLPVRLALVAATGALLLALAPIALAAKGGGKGGGGTSGGSGSSSLNLVLVNSSDGSPHWGQTVTFDVSTTATDRPYVTLTCSQNGTQVYSMTAGFYPSYPFTHYYSLSSSAWTGGAADCMADLHYSTSSGKKVTLATLSFAVYA